MLRRLLPSVAVLVAVAVGTGGCADDVAPAARVGDATITHDELMAEAAEWAGNDDMQLSVDLPVAGLPVAYASAPLGNILAEHIVLEILGQEFERRDLEITEDARLQAFAFLGIDATQEEQFFGGFSREYGQDLLVRWQKAGAVQIAVGDEIRDLIAAEAGDVEVNPRYGTWDPATLSITPPVGPRPAPSEG